MGYKINRIMMRPGGVEKQVRPTVQPIETEDIAATSYNQTISPDPSNYYGVIFKALKSGNITKVKFLYQSSHTGTLKIATGTNATAAGTTYTLTTSNTSDGEYTLLSPFEITAGTTYNIAVAPTSTCGYLTGGAGFPATRTAVQYTSGVIGNDYSSYSQMVFIIRSLIIEYLPD